MNYCHKNILLNINNLLKSHGLFKSYYLSIKNSYSHHQLKHISVAYIVLVILYFILFIIYINNIKYFYIFKFFLFIVKNCLTIVLTLFSVIFTGYSIFQALLSKRSTYLLVKVNYKNHVSYYQAYSEFFFVFLINMLSFILLSTILLFILYIFKNVCISSLTKNECIFYSLFFGLYLSVFSLLIYDVKDLILNIFHISNTIGAENSSISFKDDN